jgi:hypothetical protein
MNNQPKRLQLKGQKIPVGAVYVGRNLKLGVGLITDGIHWGNPFKIAWYLAERAQGPIAGSRPVGGMNTGPLHTDFRKAASDFGGALMSNFLLQDRIKRELRGKNLVCHCHPDLCCHGDILLKVANADGPVYCVENFEFYRL